VSGAITAGTLTSRVLGETNMEIFNSDVELRPDIEEQAA
jgi:L-cystine uptake protein TcyP (sodium:dicarboxylate symporter family)